jgi:hypothetical protein
MLTSSVFPSPSQEIDFERTLVNLLVLHDDPLPPSCSEDVRVLKEVDFFSDNEKLMKWLQEEKLLEQISQFKVIFGKYPILKKLVLLKEHSLKTFTRKMFLSTTTFCIM